MTIHCADLTESASAAPTETPQRAESRHVVAYSHVDHKGYARIVHDCSTTELVLLSYEITFFDHEYVLDTK